jgi:hypothetical protein
MTRARVEDTARAGDTRHGGAVDFTDLSSLPGDCEKATVKAGEAGHGDVGSFTPPSSLLDDGDRGRTAVRDNRAF